MACKCSAASTLKVERRWSRKSSSGVLIAASFSYT
jgi:hypothetical protein